MKISDDARCRGQEYIELASKLRGMLQNVQYHLGRVDWQSVAREQYQQKAHDCIVNINSAAEQFEYLSKLYFTYATAYDNEYVREIATATVPLRNQKIPFAKF